MLLAIGGGLDLQGERHILKRLLSEANGSKTSICVVTTATGFPEKTRRSHSDAFEALGLSDYTFLHITNAHQANDPANVEAARRADIIFFTGGDQLRLSDALQGTHFLEAVADRLQQGGIVAGTSAGAAALSRLMIYGEDPPAGDSSGKKEIVSLKTGFGFASRFIIDTHFNQRNRFARLFSMVAENPAKIGLGIDEDTAVIIHDDDSLEVIGSGKMTVIDDPGISNRRVNDLSRVTLISGQSYNTAEHHIRP
jgi:cyanophycinase